MVKDENGGLEVYIYYLECLAQATYIIAHEDKAFIIDPRRDVDGFISVSQWRLTSGNWQVVRNFCRSLHRKTKRFLEYSKHIFTQTLCLAIMK